MGARLRRQDFRWLRHVSGRVWSAESLGMGVFGGCLVLALALCAGFFSFSPAQDVRRSGPFYEGPHDPHIRAAVERAVAYLRKVGVPHQLGEAALVLQALSKAGVVYPELVSPDDHQLQALARKVAAHCTGQYQPSRQVHHGHDLYEAGCAVMGLAAYDAFTGATNHKEQVRAVAEFILSSQKPNGIWGYAGPKGAESLSDNSISQYALLGLWEANASYGIRIPPQVLDAAARWTIQTQHPTGGFVYHPLEGGEPTLSITAGAAGSLSICRDMLVLRRRRPTALFLPLRPLEEGDSGGGEAKALEGYVPSVGADAINNAIERATLWMAARLGPAALDINWRMYFFYAVERLATLNEDVWPEAGRVVPGTKGFDWYSYIAHFLLQIQESDGKWTERGNANPEVATSWGILFLVRSTKVSEKIRPSLLRGGSLISGRDLPTNPAELAAARRELRPRPPGEVRRILEEIEAGAFQDSRAVEDAVRTLERAMLAEKEVVPDPELEKWRRLAERSPDPKIRAAAMEVLGRSGQLDVVPTLLLHGLTDSDQTVQLKAREALKRISRKFEGLGPEVPSSEEEWAEEVGRWREWYSSLRPNWEVEVGED